MLQRAPGVTLLVTSRERLALPGEWLFDLSGLSYRLGEPIDGIEGYSAVQLFVQRAGQVRRQFALADGEARAVARICRLVEGLPLAIELAAAALRTRSCTAIAAAIETQPVGAGDRAAGGSGAASQHMGDVRALLALALRRRAPSVRAAVGVSRRV